MRNDPESRARLRGLYAVTPEVAETERLVRMVRECLEGGARVVQYRAKALDADARRAQASALVALCRSHGVPLIVNDTVDLALAVDADGVHLGRDDGDAREARVRLGKRLLGVSCYDDPRRAREAADAGADYVAIGSVFPSATKPEAVRAPLATLGEAARISKLPVVAIGGVTRDNAAVAIASGADMVAVISAIFDAVDICTASRAIARLFNDAKGGTDDVRAQSRAV